MRVQVPPLLPLSFKKKVGVLNMARKYYVIRLEREYEGYETNIMYIGTNAKAAIDRYTKLFQYVKQRDYLDEGVAPDRIEENFRMPSPEMNPGEQCYSGLNDGDCYYETLVFSCHTTNHFSIPAFEDRYKRETPNAKY